MTEREVCVIKLQPSPTTCLVNIGEDVSIINMENVTFEVDSSAADRRCKHAIWQLGRWKQAGVGDTSDKSASLKIEQSSFITFRNIVFSRRELGRHDNGGLMISVSAGEGIRFDACTFRSETLADNKNVSLLFDSSDVVLNGCHFQRVEQSRKLLNTVNVFFVSIQISGPSDVLAMEPIFDTNSRSRIDCFSVAINFGDNSFNASLSFLRAKFSNNVCQASSTSDHKV